MLSWWTIRRASGIGALAGISALAVWPFYATRPEQLGWPYAALLVVALLCGASILAITAVDMLRHRRRGRGMVAVRMFDILLGFGLAGLSLVALRGLLSQLPAAG